MSALASSGSLDRVLGPPEGRLVRVGGTLGALLVLVVVSAVFDVGLVEVLVSGVQTGVVYALVAVGIALVYKSTRVLNFAQGEIGTVAAFVVFLGLAQAPEGGRITDAVLDSAYPFMTMLGWTMIAIVVGAVLAVAINLGVVSRLADAAPVTTLVATVGVALLLGGIQVLYFRAVPRPFPTFTQGAPAGLELGPLCLATRGDGGACLGSEGVLVVGGANITYQFLLTAAVLVIVSIGLATFFRTPVGIALLASSQEPYAAQLQGVSLRAMSALAWGTAGAFGAVAGVLAAGSAESIFPAFMTATVLIPAIVASVLGGITSVPGAVAGALLLGLVQAYANQIVLSNAWSVPGPPQLATFVVLLLVLLFRPRGLFGKEA